MIGHALQKERLAGADGEISPVDRCLERAFLAIQYLDLAVHVERKRSEIFRFSHIIRREIFKYRLIEHVYHLKCHFSTGSDFSQ